MFPSMVQGREAATPAAAEGDCPAAGAGEPVESFDTLMNFLLDAGHSSTLAPVAEAASSPPLPSPGDTDAACAEGSEMGTSPDVVADLKRFAECLPVPSETTSLPADGKSLPVPRPPVDEKSVAGAPSVDTSPVVAAADAPPPAAAPASPPDPVIARGEDDGTEDVVVDPLATMMVPPGVAETSPPAGTPAGNEAQVPAGETDDPQAIVLATADAPMPPLSPVAAMSGADAADEASAGAVTPPAYDAAAARMSGAPRAAAATSLQTDAPLSPVTADASGDRAAPQDGDAQGLGRAPEWLAKLAGDATGRTAADGFRSLLQAAEGGAPAQAAALTYAQAGTTGPGRDTAVPSLPVYAPLRHPDWGDEVGQRVRWVIGSQLQTAELKINPPHLGPMEVRISMDADRQLNVTIASQHVLVREALQDSLPRLRDLMSDQGFGTVNVDVSQHSFSDSRGAAAQAGGNAAPRNDEGAPAADAGAAATVGREVRGLVDLYA